jgi:hypothetical protein
VSGYYTSVTNLCVPGMRLSNLQKVSSSAELNGENKIRVYCAKYFDTAELLLQIVT